MTSLSEGEIRSCKTIGSLLRFLMAVLFATDGVTVVIARTRVRILEPVQAAHEPVPVRPITRLAHYMAGAPTARILGRTVHVFGASDAKAEKVLRGLTVALAYSAGPTTARIMWEGVGVSDESLSIRIHEGRVSSARTIEAYLRGSGRPAHADLEYLISVLESETQDEASEIAVAISFQAISVALLAAMAGLQATTSTNGLGWVVVVIGAGTMFLVLLGLTMMIRSRSRSHQRRSVLWMLYELRRELATPRPSWWARLEKRARRRRSA